MSKEEFGSMLVNGEIKEAFLVHKHEVLNIKNVKKIVFMDEQYEIPGTGYPSKALMRYLKDLIR